MHLGHTWYFGKRFFANPHASSSAPYPQELNIFSAGDSSKNYGADQQRLQISDLHFDMFLHQQPSLAGR